MEPGERFAKGHDYQLVVWVSAKEGYQFRLDGNDKILTTALLNGDKPCFTSQAYEQIYGKVIDIRYDFFNVKEADNSHVCNPTAVEPVSATCTKDGRKAYYQCTCGTAYADAAATEVIAPSSCSIPATGHKIGNWTGNGTHHYKKCTVCREVITGTNAPHAGGTATCLQKAVCKNCGMQYGQTGDHKWSPKHHPVDANNHAYQCADCKVYDTAEPHTPGPEATDTQPQKCTVCDYIITPAKNHTHTYVQVEAKEVTCLIPGNLEYYTCEGCSQWWSDAAGTKPVNDRSAVTLPVQEHFAGKTWQYDGQTHWQNCVICMAMMEENMGEHIDKNSDDICDICKYSAEKAPTPPPAQPSEQESPQTDNPPVSSEQPRGITWLTLVLVALFSVVAATTVTVIILKKKK